MNLYRKLRLAIPTLLIFTSISCKKSELEDLKNAQICLNTSPAADARTCVASLSGDNSELANALKCSAVFISEGFGTPTSLLSALDQITNTTGSCTGGCSSSIDAMASLNFDSGDLSQAGDRAENVATANEAVGYCAASGVKIYSQISSIFKIGTDLSMLAYATSGGGAIDADDLQTEITNLNDADLGNLVLTTYASACNGSAESQADSTAEYCAELSTAIAGSTSATVVGNCMKLKLDDPNAVCP